MQKRTLLFIGAGLLLLAGLSAGLFFTFPQAFQLAQEAYRSVEGWAASRGKQIRLAFGISPDQLKPDGDVSPIGISTEQWNELKIRTLSYPFRDRFRRFTAFAQSIARRNGKELMIWDASRSLERQLDLYKRGRVDTRTVVTHTIGSWHLFGLAADYIIRGSSGEPETDYQGRFVALPLWYTREVLPQAKAFGLESLYLTKGIDKPHIQVPEAEWPPVVAQAREQIKSDFPGLA